MYLHASFLHELDIYEMGLGAIRLPERLCIVVPDLLDTVPGFCGAEGPDSFVPNLPATGVGHGGSRRMDEGLGFYHIQILTNL